MEKTFQVNCFDDFLYWMGYKTILKEKVQIANIYKNAFQIKAHIKQVYITINKHSSGRICETVFIHCMNVLIRCHFSDNIKTT